VRARLEVAGDPRPTHAIAPDRRAVMAKEPS
jgi:hypothetical protein